MDDRGTGIDGRIDDFNKVGTTESTDDIVKLFHGTQKDFNEFDMNKANNLSNY